MSESVCPEIVQKNFNDWNRYLGLVFFVFYSVYFPLTCFWWWTRRHHPWLKKRNFELMVISGFGVWYEITAAPLGNFVGRREFSCDLHLWLTSFIVPLGVGAVVTRLILIFNSARYNRVLLSEGWVMRAIDSGALQRLGFCGSIKAVLRLLVVNFGSIDALISTSTSQTASMNMKDTYAREEYDDSSSTRSRRFSLVIALHILTSNWFGYFILFLFSLVTLVSVVVKYTDPTSPFGNGCVGCHLGDVDIVTMGILVLLLVVIGTFMLYMVRDEPDPLCMISEIKLLFSCGLVIVAGTVLSVVDIGDVRINGQFDWINICVLASIALHTIHCPFQVYQTYQMAPTFPIGAITPAKSQKHGRPEVALSDASEESEYAPVPEPRSYYDDEQESADGSDASTASSSLDKVLETRGGRRIFKQYLATEYSVENLYFLDTVDRFRANYDHMSDEEVNSTANDIYRTFLKEGSLLQVNISAHNRKAVTQILGNPTLQVPPIETFDDAYAEVYHLLATDSFPRFKRSAFYKQWLMPTLAV